MLQDTSVERDKQGRPLGFGGRSVNSSGGGGGAGGGGGGGGGGGSAGSRNQWGDHNNSSSSNKWGNTYGLSPQFLESLNINGPLISKVFVANVRFSLCAVALLLI